MQHVFRFARTFDRVSIVAGSSPFNEPAAQRLTEALQAWGVRCGHFPLADAARARTLTEEVARTWVGLDYAPTGTIKPGDANPPDFVGFAVEGPVILLGNPQDNPLIAFLSKYRFLPYAADGDIFPGPGRGYVAWQRDGIGRNQESITLIAYDKQGMQEAVGTCYEAAAGIEPLTHLVLPTRLDLAPASRTTQPPALTRVRWTALLFDRVRAIGTDGGLVAACSHDGSYYLLGPDSGELQSRRDLSGAELEWLAAELGGTTAASTVPAAAVHQRPDRILKLIAVQDGLVAIAYWGGTLRIAHADGTVVAEQLLSQDMTALRWHAGRVIAGLADGRLLCLEVD